MIGPSDLLHSSPAPYIKTFQVFLICCSERPSFITKAVYAVKKCSWRWVSLSPETCKANSNRSIKRSINGNCCILLVVYIFPRIWLTIKNKKTFLSYLCLSVNTFQPNRFPPLNLIYSVGDAWSPHWLTRRYKCIHLVTYIVCITSGWFSLRYWLWEMYICNMIYTNEIKRCNKKALKSVIFKATC